MTEPTSHPDASTFAALTPDAMLDCVEKALGKRSNGICRPFASYINRVVEIGLAEGPPVIAKFYRPGRWSRDALRDEQDFLFDLEREEIPVIVPLAGRDGETLREAGGIHFALFPKFGGRMCDEPSPDQWRQIGRLLARAHMVGARRAPRDRILIHPRHSATQHLDYILHCGGIPAGLQSRYETAARRLLDDIAPLFEDLETHRIHGDCHRGNILWRPDEPFSLIDFDDMAIGPAAQDLWMLLPDRLQASRREVDDLLDGYTVFRDADLRDFRLMEPLRAMRFLHYTAWCARQRADGGFDRLAPGWGTPSFWRRELDDLERQRQEIEDALTGER